MPRHYRNRRRSSRPMSVTRSFKKVLNFAPSSHAAGLQVDNILVQGVDSATLGQTGATDGTVPTGSIVSEFVIQYAAVNLAAISNFHHFIIQYTIGSQSLFVPCNAAGGNNQRNQIMLQGMRSMNESQNYNITMRYKIPRKYQRVREGMFWTFSVLGTSATTDSLQVIYVVKQ